MIVEKTNEIEGDQPTGRAKLLIVQRIRKNVEQMRSLQGREKLELARQIRIDKLSIGMKPKPSKTTEIFSSTAQELIEGKYKNILLPEFCTLFQQIYQELGVEHHSIYAKIGNLWWSHHAPRYAESAPIVESIVESEECLLDSTPLSQHEFNRSTSSSSIFEYSDFLQEVPQSSDFQTWYEFFKNIKGATQLELQGCSYLESDVLGEIEARWAFVECKEIISSHFADGSRNPQYPISKEEKELQNRNRSKSGSKVDVGEMVSKFKATWLLDSPDIGSGSPVINGQRYVVSGNGRMIALATIYQNSAEKVKKYQNAIFRFAQQMNLDVTRAKTLKEPVLIRVLPASISRQHLVEFAEEGNKQVRGGFSSSEQARIDSKNFSENLLDQLEIDENGNLLSASSATFNSLVFQEVFQGMKGHFLTADGGLNQDGIKRIKEAVFFKAYEDETLVSEVFENTDTEIKNILSVLLSVSPRIAKMKADIAKGRLYDRDLTPFLKESIQSVKSAKSRGLSMNDLMLEIERQTHLLSEWNLSQEAKQITRMFIENIRSQKRMRMMILGYVDLLESYGSTQEIGLFAEEEEAPTISDLLFRAFQREVDRLHQAEHFLFEALQDESMESLQWIEEDCFSVLQEEHANIFEEYANIFESVRMHHRIPLNTKENIRKGLRAVDRILAGQIKEEPRAMYRKELITDQRLSELWTDFEDKEVCGWIGFERGEIYDEKKKQEINERSKRKINENEIMGYGWSKIEKKRKHEIKTIPAFAGLTWEEIKNMIIVTLAKGEIVGVQKRGLDNRVLLKYRGYIAVLDIKKPGKRKKGAWLFTGFMET